MKEIVYTITDPVGLHARPAGLFVKEAKKFASTVTMFNGAKKADGKKLIALMLLEIKQGTEIKLEIAGDDEETAAAELEKFLKENL